MKLIIGLGKTGLSFVNYCLTRHLDFTVVDTRDNPPCADELEKLAPNCRKHFGSLPEALFEQANELLLSPGVSLKTPEIKQAILKGKPFAGDVELFVRANKQTPIIAITGSNAKSTVTSMVGAMLKSVGVNAIVAGNIGLPVLGVINKKPQVFVLELSSFQLETTHSLKAKAATILNVCEDHMDRYEKFQDYLDAKQRIYYGAECAIVNREDLLTKPSYVTRKIKTFGLSQPKFDHGYGIIEDDGQAYFAHGTKKIIAVDEFDFKGRHQYLNILAALALSSTITKDEEGLLNGLKTYHALPHRCQFVRSLNKVDWINDSKGTNVGAAIAAVKGFAIKKNIILLMGGQSKGADLTPLQPLLKNHVKKLLVYGEDASLFQAMAKNYVDVEKIENLEMAVNQANAVAHEKDVVLLSPACASFDGFKNFADRGNQFMAWVNAL
jgi:UDP-N-acetylmuramoylalanine--D-glutamate ligase